MCTAVACEDLFDVMDAAFYVYFSLMQRVSNHCFDGISLFRIAPHAACVVNITLA